VCLQPVSVSNKLWSTTEENELHQTITVMDIYSDKSIEVSNDDSGFSFSDEAGGE